jgi:hypothetical protein
MSSFYRTRSVGCCTASTRGLGAFDGGPEDYAKDSLATLKAKIAGFKISLKNAQEKRETCNSNYVQNVFTGGIALAACAATWDGQVAWFEDRLREANAALLIKVAEAKQAKIDAATQAASDAQMNADLNAQIAAGSAAGGANTGSSLVNNPQQNALNVGRGALTAGGGGNTILYVGLGVGAVALIGGVLYMRSRKASVAGYRKARKGPGKRRSRR